jgi:hypothetical protein
MSQPSIRPSLYKGYRFPPEIISHGVWLYYRFGVSLRDVSELMLARGIEVPHEAIRLWTLRFGLEYARRLRRTRGPCSNIWHLDELRLMINGERGWLWWAVDDAGEVVRVFHPVVLAPAAKMGDGRQDDGFGRRVARLSPTLKAGRPFHLIRGVDLARPWLAARACPAC